MNMTDERKKEVIKNAIQHNEEMQKEIERLQKAIEISKLVIDQLNKELNGTTI